MSNNGKETQVSRVKQLIAGVNKHFPDASAKLTVGGAPYTVTELTALLQSLVDLRSAADVAKAAAKAKLVAESAQSPSLRGVVSALVAYVKATFGNSPDVLADFGLSSPRARAPLTAERQTVAVAKRNATRAARHTMGSQQKKSVKGAVVGVVMTPISAAPVATTPSSPTAPATSAGTTAAATPHTT